MAALHVDSDSDNAENSKEKQEIETVSKGIAKRKYLLTDEDLSQLKYEEKQNPFNKGYGKSR